MDTRLLNTYYVLGLVSGPRVDSQPTSCPPPSSEQLCSTGLPLAVETRGSSGPRGFIRILFLTALCSKMMASP